MPAFLFVLALQFCLSGEAQNELFEGPDRQELVKIVSIQTLIPPVR